MKERYTNRKMYFEELAETSEKYYIPYIHSFLPLTSDTRVLEIGCGEGGNLLPFAHRGCYVVGIDLSEMKIDEGTLLFEEEKVNGSLIFSDCMNIHPKDIGLFEVIIVHDVIEHIENKDAFMEHIKSFLNQGGILFFAFPAWQMPFGGHQQICQNRIFSKTPFIHLLPTKLYSMLMKTVKIEASAIEELLSIKVCKVTIEKFRNLLKKHQLDILDEQLYFINPHYEVKFNLRTRKLSPVIGKIPYIRNFFSTTCFYIIKKQEA